MPLKIVRYKNYGCVMESEVSKTPYDNKFFWSFFELSNGKTVRQIVKIGSGFSGSKDTTLHLGVPTGESIESITVIWNDGTEAYIFQPEINQYMEIDKSKQYDIRAFGGQSSDEINMLPFVILLILAPLLIYRMALDVKRK